jgi:hypothetical protein
MNINALSQNDSWDKFVKLAQAARIKNEGFQRTEQVQRPSQAPLPLHTGKTNRTQNAARSLSPSVTGYDTGSAPSRPHRPVLGTRFDAYA